MISLSDDFVMEKVPLSVRQNWVTKEMFMEEIPPRDVLLTFPHKSSKLKVSVPSSIMTQIMIN